MRESEFRERLEDMHRRIRDVIAQVDELRAKTIEGRVAIDNKVLLQQLHSEAAWNPRLARQPESSFTSKNDLRDPTAACEGRRAA